jgi:short subunit dehydrogenase-like uncharacterized protein
MTKRRDYDLVLFGATGFTGALTAEYLARNAPEKMRWALAGRNRAKLEQVRERLAAIDSKLDELPLIEADSADAAALKSLALSTRVVVTTVGPYAQFGEPLVAACAAAGTDYCDLTGEPEFVDTMWLRHHETARKTGARLVHCCGFDSIPHDLGAYFTVQQLPEGVPIRVDGYVRFSGEFSGGTFHSAVGAFSRLGATARAGKQRRSLEDWPLDRKIGSAPPRIRKHPEIGSWVVPFPSVDQQVVLRSAAANERYGPNFRYGHFLQVKNLKGVAKLLGGVAGVIAAAQLKPSREWLLSKKAQGDGPDAARRARSWFKVRFIGRALVDGQVQRVTTEVSGGDPGYGETSKMLAESALCLAFDRLPKHAGQMTPATAMGEALLKRLQKAGIRFDVIAST